MKRKIKLKSVKLFPPLLLNINFCMRQKGKSLKNRSYGAVYSYAAALHTSLDHSSKYQTQCKVLLSPVTM